MPTRTAPGLSADELARIRDTLAAGRKPRVVFRPGAGDQMAGQVGQVVKLTDPEASDDWVVVRFRGDDLPFSPADLEIPSKSKPPAPQAPAVAESVSATLPGPREEPSVATSTTVNGAGRPVKGAKAAPAPVVTDTPVDSAADRAAEKAAAVKRATEPAARPEPVAEAAPDAAPVPAAQSAKPARKAAKPKAPPSLTVTLTYAEGEWMVGATQGSKALAKPYVIKPAEALKMVSMLDVPGVHDAVDEIVSAARAEAEQQAEKLRAELAEIESRLAELREAG
ncbi:hypothetical protein Voc01_082390 [Virgisporangium ochraceum]|uniref:Uncharacterized protein n=2 Tax=Virgisporangium ochraceum TaxID=65505 RepID=A0A8J4A069_9ACTN|nr:hypothetical protein [Virgisporangium ochraceum]GIJ73322.1 hypothetical protein Voc01_082390 [Virgisporangium ochraceum]